MSMSTHVIGFRPPDDRWRKMKEIYDSCEAAGVAIPVEVERFFGGEPPDEAGVEVKISDTAAVVQYRNDMKDGFEIHVDKLPADVKIVRVFNAY